MNTVKCFFYAFLLVVSTSSCVMYRVTNQKIKAQAFTDFSCKTPFKNAEVVFSVVGGINGKIVHFGSATTDSQGYFNCPVLAANKHFYLSTSHLLLRHLKTTNEGIKIYAINTDIGR